MDYKSEVLIDMLKDLIEELGREPTKTEWTNSTGVPISVIQCYFSVKIVSSEQEINPHEVYLQYNISTKNSIDVNNVRACTKDTWKNFLNFANVYITKDDLIAYGQKIIKERGVIRPRDLTSHVSIIKFFGSWDNFVNSLTSSSKTQKPIVSKTNSLEQLIDQIIDLQNQIKKQYGLNLKWFIEK